MNTTRGVGVDKDLLVLLVEGLGRAVVEGGGIEEEGRESAAA